MTQKPETSMSTMSKCAKSFNFICIAALVLLGSAFASELTIDPEVQLGLELIFLNGSSIGGMATGMGMGMGIGSSEAVESLMAAGRKGSGCNKGKGASVASIKSEASNGIASGVGTGKSCPFSKNRGMSLGQGTLSSYAQGSGSTGRASDYVAADERRARRSANLQRNAQLYTEGEFENEPLPQKARIQSYSSSTKGKSKRTKYSAKHSDFQSDIDTEPTDSDSNVQEANYSNRTDDSESTDSMSYSSANSESTDSTDQSTESVDNDNAKEHLNNDYICKCKGK